MNLVVSRPISNILHPTHFPPVRSRKSQQYEPLLLENEREAVADLLQFLESTSPIHPVMTFPLIITDRTTTNFFEGPPLNALTTLSFSDNVDLQRSAALAFAEITEKEVRPVGRDTLDPILFLLSSQDTEVQRAASAALGNLAVNSAFHHAGFSSLFVQPANAIYAADNKLLIVKLGGLEPLIRQMLSPNVEVQCNAVGCFTNLATHGRSNQYRCPLSMNSPLLMLAVLLICFFIPDRSLPYR